ncbi:ATP-binding protein [Actinomadura sp. DC4]|uniref:ATP-binding protein n=1 Tax=Actinomadura sp. DC4 TaxID=3055069 RepID=UPI0025B0F417|nr:ATP-binding protein [Actinomadura sp. DC4]MDN3354124.1 ATP-binding protein [Actinomadura sp. DC4]
MSAHTILRRTAGRLPANRAVLALPAAAVITVGACLWAVAEASADRALVAVCSGAAAVLFFVTVALVVYGRDTVRGLRDRVSALDAEAVRLADEAMPQVVKRLRDGASVDSVLSDMPQPAGDAHRRTLRTLAEEVGRGERMRAAAMAACASAAGRVQALATSMLADLRDMEQRHDEEVLGDLLRLDHSTAQAGRLADSIAVLTGARSGRRWTKPITMESIGRGAVGRISAYQRVRMHSTSTSAVAGYAAEGVMHALAELMDNATSFSPPSEEVHVYVEEVHAGVVITIEDAGLGMSQAALRRAEQAVSSAQLDLTTLSGTRLGLAVVGCLARKYGLTVSFRPSSRGGTGVVVMIPRRLITEIEEPAEPPRTAPAPDEPQTAAVTAAAPEEAESMDVPEGETGGLPKRRRGQTLAAASRPAITGAARTATGRPSDTAAKFSTFRDAIQTGRTPQVDRPEGADDDVAPHDET